MVCLASLSLLLVSVIVAGYVHCQEQAKIIGQKGNAADPDADILEVDFELLENKSFVITYTIAGNFLSKYVYGIEFFAYGENQSFASIVLGTFEQKYGVYFFDSETYKVTALQYTIDGSTLKIAGLTLAMMSDRYAFYALAKTGQGTTGQSKTVVWLDYEPRQGAVKIMFPSPSLTATQASPTETPSPQTQPQSTTVPTTITPMTSQNRSMSTQDYAIPITVIMLVALIGLSGLVIRRSRSKKIVAGRKAKKR
jgi:hypothetical protein